MVAVVALAWNAEARAPAGAGQVVCQGRRGEPRGIGLEMTGRRVGEAAVLDIGDHSPRGGTPSSTTAWRR